MNNDIHKLHVLRVDLTRGKIVHEYLHRGWRICLLGGKGIGTRLLYDEVQPGTDTLGPDNEIIITVGPATGTVIPMQSRYGIFFKSPQTGIYCESYSGGSVAPVIKYAGLDMIVIRGKAERPVYLYIDDGKAELRSAARLWGLDTYTTDVEARAEIGDRTAKVISIGLAGENLVKFANITNDYWRQAGRGGSGAVMGSKKLKAIVIRSSNQRSYTAKPEMLQKTVEEIFERIRKDPTTSYSYPTYGTSAMVDVANEMGFFPTQYWRESRHINPDAINGDALRRFLVKNKACWNCPVACGKYVEADCDEGKKTGVELEYETIYAFGGLCLISKIEEIIEINNICDRYGIDTITTGNVVGFIIEACNQGKVELERRVKYGDVDSMRWLIDEIVNKRGIGAILADGVYGAARTLGLDDLAIHVKGLEPPGYDPRTLKGMALSYATSPRGACHLRSGFYYAEARGLVDPLSVDEQKVSMFVDWERKCTIFDSLILCRFGRFIFDWPMLARVTSQLIGYEYDKTKLANVADDIINLTRLFNVREGINRNHDCLPKRFLSESVTLGSQKYVTAQADLNSMLNEYYRLHDWDNLGIPRKVPLTPIETTY